MAININVLVAELEHAVRNNLRNFDSMLRAVGVIFHRDLDGRSEKEQNKYIRWFMRHFGTKKHWIFRVPTVRRIQLMGAIAIGRKFSYRHPSLAELVTAGEAVLAMDVDTFRRCFKIT